MVIKWVTIPKLSDLMGYTEDAIRAKIKRHVWRCNTHWLKAPDGRILLNVKAIEQWVEKALNE